MTVTLLLLGGLGTIVVWWLSGQRLAAKPWLEVGGIEQFPGTGPSAVPAAKLGLWVFLAVAASLFALVISAYFMRMHLGDWRPLPEPRLLWLNTAVLVMSSVAMRRAELAARGGRMDAVRASLLVGGALALVFLVGQILAWRELVAAGYFLAGNPANGFFYLITAAHGLHLLGGLVALARVGARLQHGDRPDRIRLSVELCALYWHFLLLAWIVLFALLLQS